MRLVIDTGEQYKQLFYEVAKAPHATIVEDESDVWTGELPGHVINGIERALSRLKKAKLKPTKM
ncbi:MAG TPA: hypothetical protein VIM55_02800 [Mucilaginibacter sp.]